MKKFIDNTLRRTELYYAAFFVFFFMMPFWRVWSTVAMFTVLATTIFREKRAFSAFSKTEKYFLVSSLALFSLYIFSYFRFETHEDLFDCQKRVGFIFIPIGVLFIKELKVTEIKLTVWGLLAGVFLMNMINIGQSIIFYYNNKYLPFANGSEIANILIIERPYIGYLNSLAFIFSSYFVTKNHFKKTNILLSSSFIFSVFLISARASIIVIALIIIYWIFVQIKNPLKAFMYSLAIPLFIISGILMNPNLKERIISAFDYEPRTIIWPSILESVKEEKFSLLFGAGSEIKAQELLNEKYKFIGENSKKWDWIYDTELRVNYNSHNQFLGFLLSYGVFGLLILSFWLFTPLLSQFGKAKNHLLILTIFVLSFNFLLENYLARQIGVYMSFLLLSLLVRPDFKRVINDFSQEKIPQKNKE